MKVKELLLTPEQVEQIGDMETILIRRKEKGTIAGYLAILIAVLQVIFLLIEKGNQLLELGFGLPSLSEWFSNPLQLIFWVIFALALLTFFLLRYTATFMEGSKEPFRYTFWIESFKPLGNKENNEKELFQGSDKIETLLDHDLKNMLNERIKRFSILEDFADNNKEDEKKSKLQNLRPSSHIHIYGHYVLRLEENNEWIVQITPLIRIGSQGTPATLATPIRFLLSSLPEIKTNDGEEINAPSLSAGDYKQIVERVYSRVSTEVYARIEEDVKQKIALFPSDYLKALALYYEAEDFARSNTIDGYERAISLFKESLALFQKIGIPSHWFNRFIRFRWSSVINHVSFRQVWAKTVIGYAKCMIYRNQMASLSGRRKNPLFALPELLESVRENLVDLHKRLGGIKKVNHLNFLARTLNESDHPQKKRSKIMTTSRFGEQRRILFEAYIVSALAYRFLESIIKAKEQLSWAEVTSPDELHSSPLYLLAKGLLEPDSNKALLHFQNAVDLEPNFQIAHWFLANALETDFRRRDEISPERARSVIRAYDEVLFINAGNIASMGAQGHLWWLVNDPKAEKILKDGVEIKAIARETFIGDLNFRLARIAAEKGDFNECREKFLEASATDPSIGAFGLLENSRGNRTDYDLINDQMFQRFEAYQKTVKELISSQQPADSPIGQTDKIFSRKTLKIAYAFVLNDYGNACLRHFHHHGDEEKLLLAISAYRKATEENPEMAVTWYNLQNAYGWAGEWAEIGNCMENAKNFAPSWSLIAIQSASQWFRTPKGDLQKTLDQLYEIDREIQSDMMTLNATPEETHTLKLEKLEERKVQLEKEFQKKFNTPLLIIKENSRLAPLFDGKIEDLITRLVKIPWKNLDGDDLSIMVELAQVLAFSNELTILESARILGLRLQALFPQDHYIITIFKGVIIKITFLKVNQLFNAVFGDLRNSLKDQQGNLENLKLKWEETQKKDLQNNKLFLLSESMEFLPPLVETLIFGFSFSQKKDLDQAWKKLHKRFESSNKGRDLFDLDSLLMDMFVLLKLLFVRLETTNAAIEKEINSLIQEFEEIERNRQELVKHWMKIEKGTFLSLYWYISVQQFSNEKKLHALKEKYFSLVPDNFENLLGNTYLQYYMITNQITFLNMAAECFIKTSTYDKEKSKYHFNLGGTYFRLEKWREAQTEIVEAIRKGSDENIEVYQKKLAATINRIGNTYYEKGEYLDAKDHYEQAIGYDGNMGVYYYNLFLALENLTSSGDENLLSKSILALEKAIALDSKYKANKVDLIQLRRKKAVEDVLGKAHSALRTAVSPITIEYDKSLDPQVMDTHKQALNPVLLDKIGNLRKEFFKKMGLTIPTVLFRLNDSNLSHGQYFFTLNEIPTVLYTLYVDQRLCLATGEELDHLEVHGIPITDPLERVPALWIQEKDWSKLESAGFALMDPLDYLLRHLEGLIIKNLADIFGMEEVAILCQESSREGIKEIPNDPDKLRDLTEVCKALLAEEIPIVDFEDIVLLFLEGYHRQPLESIIEETRRLEKIKAKLPGNNPQLEKYIVGPKLEVVLKENLIQTGNMFILALSPQVCQEVLAAVRKKIPNTRPLVLVVKDSSIRIHLRKLTELEFPNLHVLAQSDLMEGWTWDPEKTVEQER